MPAIPGGRFVLALGAGLGVSGFFTPVVNPDLWWHLSAGRRILESLSWPRADWLSSTMQGRPWMDFEWLIQIVYQAAHGLAGCAGLIGTRAVLLGCVVWLGIRILALNGASPAGQGLGALWLAAAILPNSDVRPDNFSLALFSTVLYVLEASRLGRWRWRAGHTWLALLIFCAWANMHPGFFYGLALIGLYAAGTALDNWQRRALGATAPSSGSDEGVKGRNVSRLRAGHTALVGAACLTATLLNPYGWGLHLAAWSHLEHMGFLIRHISEWTPPLVSIEAFAPYWALLAASYIAALLHFGRTRATPYAHILCLLFFGLSSSLHRRHVAFFAVAALPVLFCILRELRLDGRRRTALRAAGVLGFVLLVRSVGVVAWKSMAPGSPWPWCSTPGARAAVFLRQEAPELAGKRLFHGWGQGGYLGWSLYPDYRVFYDGRYIFHSLLQETTAAQESPEAWTAFLRRRGIEVAVLRWGFGREYRANQILCPIPDAQTTTPVPSGGPNRLQGPAWRDFMPAKEWALVYEDGRDMILVRRSSVSRKWLSRKELLRLGPLTNGGPRIHGGRMSAGLARPIQGRREARSAYSDAAARSPRARQHCARSSSTLFCRG